MNSYKKALVSSGLLLILLSAFSMMVSADAWANISTKMSNVVCSFKTVFAYAATGVASFTMVLAGVQWISSDTDPGARKKAKTTIIHAMVGLLIVYIANDIVNIILSSPCPAI